MSSATKVIAPPPLSPALKLSNASKNLSQRTRPAFEQILIGPICCLGEMVTGGHYLEVLRVAKVSLKRILATFSSTVLTQRTCVLKILANARFHSNVIHRNTQQAG